MAQHGNKDKSMTKAKVKHGFSLTIIVCDPGCGVSFGSGFFGIRWTLHLVAPGPPLLAAWLQLTHCSLSFTPQGARGGVGGSLSLGISLLPSSPQAAVSPGFDPITPS